jgi:hypothetical protein
VAVLNAILQRVALILDKVVVTLVECIVKWFGRMLMLVLVGVEVGGFA